MAVANNHHRLQCDNCHLWVHIKCHRINLQTYKYLQKIYFACYCLESYETFTAITKMVSARQDLIDQLNNAMDDPTSENN